MKERFDRHYLMVIIACCGMIGVTLGVANNLGGLFFNPIASELAIGRGTVAFTITMYSLSQAIVGLYAPSIIRHTGLKKTALLGSAVMISATVLLARVSHIIPMIILNVFRGMASGFIGTVTVNIMINYWFHKNSSLITSIAMGFSGIVGAIMSPILSNFITVSGWRSGYLLTAVLIAVLLLPVMVFPIGLRPQDVGMKPYGYQKEAGAREVDNAPARHINSLLFIVMMLYTVCAPSPTSLPQHYVGITETYGMSGLGPLMVSATLITNTGGKLLMGLLIDRFGARKSVSAYALGICIAIALIAVGRNVPVLMAGALLLGLAYSMGTVATSSMVRDLFGPENYSKVYPRLFFGITISSSTFTTLVGAMYDFTGSYTMIIITLGIMSLIAFLLVNFLYSHQDRAS